MNPSVWIIPWYREQDWPDWRSLCQFEGSHKDWLRRAEAGAEAHGRRGLTVARVVIEPRKFLEWRRVHRGKITDHDRMHYAISLYAEREDIGQANR